MKAAPGDDCFLDTRRLCERVCISKGTLRTWKALGLPFYAVNGGKDLFYFREVKEWLRSYRTIEQDLDAVVREVTSE